jgi:YHS domain-containing protein
MTRLVLSFAVVLLAVQCLVLADGPTKGEGPTGPTTRPTTQPVAQGTPINKFCAVNKDEEIDPTVTYVYNGKVIGFCCDSCIPKFKKDPEKYMKDLK